MQVGLAGAAHRHSTAPNGEQPGCGLRQLPSGGRQQAVHPLGPGVRAVRYQVGRHLHQHRQLCESDLGSGRRLEPRAWQIMSERGPLCRLRCVRVEPWRGPDRPCPFAYKQCSWRNDDIS